MNVFIGADHRGFELKGKIKNWLKAEGYLVVDCGNQQLDPKDDFPDFVFAVAEKVQSSPENRGIVICGSGVGVNIAANKVSGIRASTVFNPDGARHARQHDNLNLLGIASDYTSEKEAIEMIAVFLSEKFKPEERFLRRLKKIEEYEQ